MASPACMGLPRPFAPASPNSQDPRKKEDMSDFDFEDDSEDGEFKSDKEYWADYYAKYPEPSNVFVRAAANGDIDTVRRMLGEGADINQQDKGFPTEHGSMSDMRKPNTFGATALEMAGRTKNLEMLKLLYEAGADPSPADAFNRNIEKSSIVDTAVFSGFTEGLRYLVDEQGLPLHDGEEGAEAWLLVRAISDRSSVELLRYLVEEKGMSLDQKTENGISPASTANSILLPPEFLEYIYSKGAVPTGTQHVWPKLRISFAEGAKNDLEDMTGEDFNSFEGSMKLMDRYASHSTLLNEAVFNGDVEKVRIHLKYGADPLEKDDKGVDAIGVLQRLKKAEGGIYRYWEEHAAVEQLLEDAIRRQQKPTPGAPTP